MSPYYNYALSPLENSGNLIQCQLNEVNDGHSDITLYNEIPWKTAFAKYWTSESLTAYNFVEPWLPLTFHIYESVFDTYLINSWKLVYWGLAMSFLFLITPVQSTGGPIIINRNQFDINVYLISVFYFKSAFKKEIVKVK